MQETVKRFDKQQEKALEPENSILSPRRGHLKPFSLRKKNVYEKENERKN